MRGSTAVSVNTCVIFFFFFFSLRISLTCCAHVRMFCVNQLSGRERGGKEKKGGFFFFFSPAGQQMSEFMFYWNQIWPSPPSLAASRWSLWREGDYLAHLSQGTWECWCWVGSAVPRQASCPQEPEYDPLYLPPVSGPLPPSSTPPPARLTAASPPPSSSSTSSSPPLSVSTLG